MSRSMISKAIKFAVSYVVFFWSIAWRTFALSIATAILTGFGLGIVTITNNLPSDFISVFAPMIGLPITLLVGAFVVYERMISNVKRAN